MGKKSLSTLFCFISFGMGMLCMSLSQAQNLNKLQVSGFPLIGRSSFVVKYDSAKRIPLYTYEKLTPDSLKRNVRRSSQRFKKDPQLYPAHQSSLLDYQNKPFDRGHMVAAANQMHNAQALEETFYLSNICPQNSTLNRGLWAKLEQSIRRQVTQENSVEIVTGPLFLSHPEGNQRFVRYEVIGQNEVAVPTHFFKVVQSKNETLAYVIPNKEIETAAHLNDFLIPIATLEKLSGLEFQRN